MSVSNIICSNCGKRGHKHRNCLNPITSYGIICLNYLDEDLNQYIELSKQSRYSHNIRDQSEYQSFVDKLGQDLKILMICRKDTIGYIEIIRGVYDLDDKDYILTLLNLLTEKEKKRILDNLTNFDFLWVKLWSLDLHNVDRHKIESEYPKAKQKYEQLNKKYGLEELLDQTDSCWEKAEWGFPKGRRNIKERDLDCACREFEEETGFSRDDYQLLNMKPIYENYKSCNGKIYRHIYFVAQSKRTNLSVSVNNVHQFLEISDIKWVSYLESLNLIRDYHKEKKKSLRYLFNQIKNIFINADLFEPSS